MIESGSRLSLFVAGGWGVVRRDLTVFLSYRTTAASQLLSTLFGVLIFYYVSRLVTAGSFGDPDQYFSFALIGILILEVIAAPLILLPIVVRQELVAGTFERMVVSPFGPVRGICAMLVFPITWALVKATVVTCLAALVFGLPLAGPQALLAVPVALLGVLSFAPFGILIAAAILLFKQASSLGTWIVGAISLVAGIYFPSDLLPRAVSWMADVQPFTPTAELLRHLVLGLGTEQPAGVDLLKIAAFALVVTPVALVALQRAIDRARGRGTLIEY